MTSIDTFKKGQQHLLNGNYKLALQKFDEVVNRQPDIADYHSERGVALFHLNRKKEALDALNLALSLEPENSYRYSSRAFVKDSMGDIDGAIKDYLKCTELDPDDAIAFNNLGMLEEKIGRIRSAKYRFKKADELISLQGGSEAIQKKDTTAKIKEPINLQEQINQERKVNDAKGITGIVLDVFRSKGTRKEFFKFIKGDLNTKDDDLS